MAQPNNSYARRAREDMRDARRATAKLEQAERERNRDPDAKARRERRMQAMAEAFDMLTAGDSLELFGLSATVRKKNRKSVATSMGTRWTRKELTGVE